MTTPPPSEARIRMLVVDDSEDVRAVFQLLMSDHPEFEFVGALNTANNLLERIAQDQPHVVVLDISMPGCDPLQAMIAARDRFSSVRFLVSSAYDDPSLIDQAFQSGAHGYLLKEGDFDKLADAIRAVAAGQTVRPRRRYSR